MHIPAQKLQRISELLNNVYEHNTIGDIKEIKDILHSVVPKEHKNLFVHDELETL